MGVLASSLYRTEQELNRRLEEFEAREQDTKDLRQKIAELEKANLKLEKANLELTIKNTRITVDYEELDKEKLSLQLRLAEKEIENVQLRIEVEHKAAEITEWTAYATNCEAKIAEAVRRSACSESGVTRAVSALLSTMVGAGYDSGLASIALAAPQYLSRLPPTDFAMAMATNLYDGVADHDLNEAALSRVVSHADESGDMFYDLHERFEEKNVFPDDAATEECPPAEDDEIKNISDAETVPGCFVEEWEHDAQPR